MEVMITAWMNWQTGFGGRGNRYRWMYYLTGTPGWLRFGFSPGWLGRSPTGLPPTAQWIISSGLLPQYTSYLAQNPPVAPVGPFPTAPVTPTTPGLTKEQEKQMLEQQMKILESQLEAIKKRLEDLK